MLKLTDLGVRVGEFSLNGVNLQIADGEYFVILGESGAGKTVLLETIAGRYPVERGAVEINGRNVSAALPETRNIGFVYQNYELFSHMTVEQNVAFGLKYRGITGSEQKRKTRDMMEILSLSRLAKCYPGTLSGGEKQRVALGRALIISPKLLLLDEPLSALDYVTKRRVRETIRQTCRRFAPMVIHVTHDIEEALFFADRIGIIKDHGLGEVFGPEQIANMEKSDFYAYL
jgi:ABC-type sugar transport system ATPase subunit